MEKFVYQQLADLEENHWWYRGRERIIVAFLDQVFKGKPDLEILDVGCGAGSVLKLLSLYGKAVGVDNYKPLVAYCQQQGESVTWGDVTALPFPDDSFGLVVALEVLEHVEDDSKALSELYRVLKKSGLLFLSVPAFPFLWGNHDLAAGHKRRYRRDELIEKLRGNNFSIAKITYMNFFLFPFIFIFRAVRKVFSKPEPQLDSNYFSKSFRLNSLLSFTLGLEAILFNRFSLPFGATLLCVARKDGIT